jgi:eukaryotic-like serine/threonine-protein kinase
LVKAIVDTEPVRPSDRVAPTRTNGETNTADAAKRGTTPDKLRRLLCGDLDTIVTKALKKDPAERYCSVTAFADDLRRYLRNEPIGARPDTLAYRAAKFARRNRTAMALTTLAVAATLTGVAGTWMQARTARTQRDLALRHLARAEQVADLNELLLTDVAPMGKPLMVNQLLEREEHIVEREHYRNAANHVELLISIGKQYSGEEENSRALRVLNEAYQLSRGLQERSIRAKASCEFAWGLLATGELTRAESLFKQGLREFPDGPQFGPDRVLCLLDGSEVAYRSGDSKRAIDRARAAARALKQSPVQSATKELDVLVNLAGVYGDAGQFPEALAAFEQASVLMTNLGYDETQKAAKLFNDWALTLFYVGRPLEAERLYRHAIDISRSDQTEDAVLPVLLYNYAGALRELGRLSEAVDYTERASMKAQRAGDQILVDQADLQLARIYRDKRDFTRSKALLAELEPRLRRKLPPAHYAFASLASEKALLAQAEGDLATALRLADQAVAIDEASIKAIGQCSAYLPTLLVRRSAIEFELRQQNRAAEDAARALGLLQRCIEPGVFSSNLGRAYLALGRARKSQGRDGEPRGAFRSAAEHLQNTLSPEHPDARYALQLAEFASLHP